MSDPASPSDDGNPDVMERDDRAALILSAAGRDLLGLGRLELARTLAEMALSCGRPQPNCHSVMAGVLEELGEWEAALPHWRAATALAPQSPGHRHNLALALLLRDSWCEAAALYESRLEKSEWSSLAAAGSLDGIRFRLARPGDPLAGRRVLAFTEQGLGDCIWAARWLADLVASGAVVTIATRPQLAPLFARIAPDLPRIEPPAEQPAAKVNLAALVGRFDLFVPMMSLPGLLGVEGPGATMRSYLRPDRARVAAWRERYEKALPGRRRIGVVWRASPTNASSPRRSLPVEALAPLSAHPELGIVNLQSGSPETHASLAKVVAFPFDALNAAEPPLDEFAAAIAATDLLLTVDTMAAHLAGALGHRAIVLVPAVPHFYWGLGRSRCPWYPTLRLIRQSRVGDWQDAVAGAVDSMLSATGVVAAHDT
jgi:ADP-heptose:LPS heptosyltransferase